MTAKKCLVLLPLLFGLGVPDASAGGVSPYLPLNLAPEIERQVERVLILAGKPVLKRPFAAATVLDALPRACEIDAVLCTQVRRFLDRYMRSTGMPFVGVELARQESRLLYGASKGPWPLSIREPALSEAANPVPNRGGLSSDSAWSVSGGAFWRLNDYASLSFGGVAYDGNSSLSGTMLSAGFEHAQLDIGFRDHWFSPTTDSAMLIGTNAATMPSVTLSNYSPLTGLNVSYEAFVARMSRSERIFHRGELTVGNPLLAGVHLAVEPVSGWSLSFNRMLQFGGGDRSRSLSDFLRAFFRPVQADNAGPDLTVDEEFGNQFGSIATSLLYPGPVPFSVYLEYAGEDGSRKEGWRLGNVALTGGIRFPQLWCRFDLTLELSEWQNAWYVHHLYGDGLINDGRTIGHWAADGRSRDAVGGRAGTLRLGWDIPNGDLLEVQYRTAKNERYSRIAYQREHQVALTYSRALEPFTVGAELLGGRNPFGEEFGRLAAFVRFPGWRTPSRSSDIVPASISSAAQGGVFIEAGVSYVRVQFDLSTDGSIAEAEADAGTGAHVAIGARRTVSARSDLGVRLELDQVSDELFLAVRAIDYRYRFDAPVSLSVFVGAARYDPATPAYGYYGGAGVQWRNVLPRLDVNLDLRLTDKMARDILLPEDPVNGWGDLLYQMRAVTVSLSYRL